MTAQDPQGKPFDYKKAADFKRQARIETEVKSMPAQLKKEIEAAGMTYREYADKRIRVDEIVNDMLFDLQFAIQDQLVKEGVINGNYKKNSGLLQSLPVLAYRDLGVALLATATINSSAYSNKTHKVDFAKLGYLFTDYMNRLQQKIGNFIDGDRDGYCVNVNEIKEGDREALKEYFEKRSIKKAIFGDADDPVRKPDA